MLQERHLLARPALFSDMQAYGYLLLDNEMLLIQYVMLTHDGVASLDDIGFLEIVSILFHVLFGFRAQAIHMS